MGGPLGVLRDTGFAEGRLFAGLRCIIDLIEVAKGVLSDDRLTRFAGFGVKLKLLIHATRAECVRE